MRPGKKITPFRDPDREREDRILEVVDRLLARHGYSGLQFDEVARVTGLTKSALHLCFQSRQDLILGHADWIARRIAAGEAAIAAKRDTPGREKIRELLFYRVMAHFDAVQHFAESLEEIMRDVGPSLLGRRDEAMRREVEVLRWLLEEGGEAAIARGQDSRATARALLTLTNALLPYNVSPTQFLRRRQLEENLRCMIDLLMDGIGANCPGQRSRLEADRARAVIR